MEEIEFIKINNVVVEYLDKENDTELEIIGSWYFRFLESDEKKFSLHLPSYTVEFTNLAFTYIRVFTVVLNFLKQNKLTNFKDTCLFNIFNESSRANIDNLTLDFLEEKDNLALWGEDTLTKLEEFLPVFNKEELIEFGNPKTIKNTFKLFKAIRDLKIIISPQLINLQEKILSFNNIDNNLDNELISENLLLIENNLDDDSAIELEDELIDKELNNRICVKYPYSKKSHPYLMDVGKKKFKLVFNNRFAYNDILGEDIYLLENETKLSTQLAYNIVDTKHSTELYELFKNFKEHWTNLELNKYINPFPKYWFLFLNPSLSKEEWLIQFKKDFPTVAEKPIIKIVESIINEVINLNWIKDEITGSTKILFPELKSNRKKRLEFIYNNFKNYINTINQKVEFISNLDLNNYENVIVLDSFNIIDLVNKNQCDYRSAINIVVPDFIYFGYQPWIKYHLFNYQFTPLLSGLREILDTNFISNKEKIEDLRTEIVNEIKSEFKIYKNKYKEEEQKVDPPVEQDENPSEEDIEFTNEEEVENADLIKERNEKVTLISINQNLENELTISSTEKVLLQKDTLLYVKAGNLKIGDLIIRTSDISKLYKTSDIYERLISIPDGISNYQNELFRKENSYQLLRKKGLSIDTEYHFKKKYLIEHCHSDNFILPKIKRDRLIICDFLNISQSDLDRAFIAHYGRSEQNELKKMYKSIIDLLLENNWIGTIEDPNVVASVSELVNKYNNIFKTTDKVEVIEISKSIISTVLDQLKFTDISTIKTIENE